MRIEDLTVALRPRNPWEAVELGTALTRRHLGAVLRPWLAISLPVFVLLNLLCWSVDLLWLASGLMWWLKPAFDRVPLFVLSRAVFGHVPGTRQTLRAQFTWGRRWLPAYLTWRRLSPVRSLHLPVDLLEGGEGEQAGARRRALAAPVYGVAGLVTLAFVNFEIILYFGVATLGLLFIPQDVMEEAAARMWNVLVAQPVWLQLAMNGLAWLATTLVEPFYIGAGFGLYLNRRTQIEGWDIEMALRRLRARLAQAVAPVLLLAALGLAAAPAHATASTREQDTLQDVFGERIVRDEGWEQSVKRAYEDPQVRPRKVIKQWVKRDPDKPREVDGDWAWLATALGLVGEYGLWVLAGIAVLALLLTAPRWVRWLRDAVAAEERETAPVVSQATPAPLPLPPDIPASALRLWREGHERDALALMYRASVEDMARRAQVALVPGATEAHTLRASRKLPRAQDREVFARAVRTWQYAAYAHGLPSAQEFESLLRALVQAFSWPTTSGLDGPAPEGAA